MAGSNGNTISINIRAVTDQLTSGLNKAKSDVKSWQSTTQDSIEAVEASTERISRLWRSAFEAFLGFEAVNMLKKLAIGAADAANELAVASQVASNFGHSLNPAAMEAWLEGFAKSAKGGGYAIDEMRKSVQTFAAVGLDVPQIQRAIADTAELAASRNLEWSQAAHIVQMALTGHVEMLTRYGIISREAAKGITTVEQAMEALEKASKGAAEQRAQNLLGTLGRLGNAATLLAESIGTSLEPFFTAVATIATGLANLLNSIPAAVMKVAGTVLAFATSLAALVLVLPAVAKGIAIMGEGLRLVTGLVMPAIVLVARLATTLGLGATGFEAFTAAELASIAPIAALIVALAGVTVAVVEIVKHTDHVKTAWHDWCQYLGDSFHEFVENFKRDHLTLARLIDSIGKLAMDTVTLQVTKWKGDISDILNTAAPKATAIDLPKVGGADAAIGGDVVSDWKKIGSQIVGYLNGLFKSSLGKSPAIPTEAFTGIIPKTGSDKSGAAAENALKNFDETTKNWLANFAAKVDDAKAKVDISAEKLADFDVRHPAGQAMSAADQAERQKLVNDQLEAERNLREQLLNNQRAEIVASNEYLKIATQIPAQLKNHDELVRQARDAAREHAKAARDIYLNYLRAGTELDTLIAKEQQAARVRIETAGDAQVQAANQQLDAQKAAIAADIESIDQAIAMAQVGGNAGVSWSGATESSRERDFREQTLRATRGGGAQPSIVEDRLKIALAQLALAAAKDEEATKKHTLAILQEVYDKTKSKDDLDKLTAAQNALTQATMDVVKANDAYLVAQQKLTLDLAQKWDTLMNGLIQKVGAPGLSGAGSATSPLSFNPMQFLFAALEQTQAFADVMNTATAITNTLVQAFEAFRPIIDAVMDVVRAVANVFIFLYNAVARILDLFGLQIQQLQYLTDAMSGLVPLISIVHEIPTLNELAAGRLNSPLSTVPTGLENLGQSNGGQNTLMRIVEVLVGILAAIIIERVIAGLSFQQAVQQTLHLLGINVGQKAQTAQAAAESAKSDALQTTLSAKETALQTALGAKAAGLTLLTNTLLQQIWSVLEQILAAIQTQSSGGVGGLSSLLGGIGMEGRSVGGAMGQAAKGIGDAAQRAAAAIGEHARQIQQATAWLARMTNAMQQLVNATSSASRALYALPGGGSIPLSQALAMDTDRRTAVTGYGIDRVPM
jgi:hypothetical protein